MPIGLLSETRGNKEEEETCGFVTDSLFVAQRGSHFRLHCAIQVQNHYCSQEKTFGNLLSRLEEDKFSGSDLVTYFIIFFLLTTRVYFVII